MELQTIITIATCVIAASTIVNVILVFSIKSKNEQYQQEVKDLHHATFLSTLATTFTGGSRDDGYNWFAGKYKEYKSGNLSLDQLKKSS